MKSKAIAGFVPLSGDRHSFSAGYTAKALPPNRFEPVGINFVTGSIFSPGMVEAFEHTLADPHSFRSLYLIDRPGQKRPEAAVNLLLRHGERTCLDYADHGDLARAKVLRNPDNAPHVEFVDMGGHGFGVVRASASDFSVGFVCTPRPIASTSAPDGGPIRYRVVQTARLWSAGETPKLKTKIVAGDAELSA